MSERLPGRSSDEVATADLLALVPAYQEAPRIAAVVRGALAHLPVLVIDDGSTDGTAEIAEASGAEVVRQRPNQGKGAALRAGFRLALERGCAAVVTLDADGQHDPSEIPRFVGAFRVEAAVGSAVGSADLIVGRRDFTRMPLVRRIANILGGLAFSWAAGRRIPDNQCGYRLVSRRLMAALLDSGEDGFAFEVEMIAVCVREGWRIEWVPISTIYAGEPSHIRPLAHITSFARAVRDARRLVRRR